MSSKEGVGKRHRDKRHRGKRRRAREMAIQMLYQKEMGGCAAAEIFGNFDILDYVRETDLAAAQANEDEGRAPADESQTGEPRAHEPQLDEPPPLSPAEREKIDDSFAYAQELFSGVSRHVEAVDELIRRHAENWRLERMPVIDRNILRLAVYEMLHESSVPKVVIVDEAIELAKKFGSENSGRFVNGLLDGVLKSGAGAAAIGSGP